MTWAEVNKTLTTPGDVDNRLALRRGAMMKEPS